MQIEFSEEIGSSEAARTVTVQKTVVSPAVPKHETIDPYEDPGHVVMGGAVRRHTK